MNTTEILSALDSEISHLTKVRDLLSSLGGSPEGRGKLPAALDRQVASAEAEVAPKRGRGRPKGSTNKSTGVTPAEGSSKRRTMSAAGRERIAAAQRARWAKRNGQAAAKPTAGKSAVTKAEGKTTSAKKGAPPVTRRKVGRPKKTATTAPATKVAAKKSTKAVKRPTSSNAAKPAKKISAKKTPVKQGSSGAETAVSRSTETNATA